MKKSTIVILSTLAICICHSCSKKQLQESTDQYPFNVADKIEVLSYENRFKWDTIQDTKVSPLKFAFVEEYEKSLGTDTITMPIRRIADPILRDGRLRFGRENIKESIILNAEQTEKLYSILYNPASNNPSNGECYFPQYAILFYNEKGEIIESFEFSLECQYHILSRGMHIDLCQRKFLELETFLKEIGITYFQQYL